MSLSNLIAPNSSITLYVTPECINLQRLDVYLSTRFALYSRTFFARWIAQGAISINGKIITKPSRPVQHGDTINIIIPEQAAPDSQSVKEVAAPIQVIYEHAHFLVVHKPVGVVVHKSASSSTESTVVDWLTQHYDEIKQVGYIDRPGIVHRLDKDTSGLMVVARTNHAHTVFTNLFKERAIQKTYTALVHGHPEASGMIDFPIARHPVHRKKMIAVPAGKEKNVSGKIRHALTYYTVQQYFDEYSHVVVKPVTGRTHQIRVHFSALGHPLVGDGTYGKSSKLIGHHVLHAQELSFTFDGEAFTFFCEPPEVFNALIRGLKS